MGELVDNIEYPVFLPIMGPIFHEVVGPNMIPVLGQKPDARSVIEPQPAALRLLPWNLQPLAQPDSLNPLVIDQPARVSQQRCDLAVAVATIETGKFNDVSG